MLLNQVMLQAPDVAQDSFGQFHVRGDHNDLQYRLNGIILPEGISVFGQILEPRLISSMSLITGALPAEYGLRTAGIIDLTTKSGLLQPGGTVSVYGGSHDTFESSVDYGGSDRAISATSCPPTCCATTSVSSRPTAAPIRVHDHATQIHALRLFRGHPGCRQSPVAGAWRLRRSISRSRISAVCSPRSAWTSSGQSDFLSDDLNENQHELTQYAILSWQHSQGALDWQSSLTARYTSLDFEPDWTGDLLYNGIAQNAFKQIRPSVGRPMPPTI